MRRVVITLGIVAILVSSCGRDGPQARFEGTLEDRVTLVRDLAEKGKPGLARDRLKNVIASVTSRLDRGLIDEGWALEILESARAVDIQLRLLPTASASEAPDPSPVDEEGGEEDPDGGDGKGKGKDKSNGNGDEGHGNDD